MQVTFRRLELVKLYPLAISRGVTTVTENLFVEVTQGGFTGIGELAPATASAWTAESGEQQLKDIVQEGIEGRSITQVWDLMKLRNVDPPAMAALDVALWDLHAKQAGMPLYRLLGLPNQTVETSVTIGINPPEVVRERVPAILRQTGGRCLKIKLGSPAGIDADKESFLATKEVSQPFGVKLRVDANGGWSLSDAIHMVDWLSQHGVDYVEQPLVQGAEDQLPELFAKRKLPIFADESCRWASDVPKLADRVDGVNLKLMKCGGLTEALRLVAVARAHGLKTMIGCMSESSVAIGAGAHIASLFDHIDLDSHLNLNPDPAVGLRLEDGKVLPTDAPGLGVHLST